MLAMARVGGYREKITRSRSVVVEGQIEMAWALEAEALKSPAVTGSEIGAGVRYLPAQRRVVELSPERTLVKSYATGIHDSAQ